MSEPENKDVKTPEAAQEPPLLTYEGGFESLVKRMKERQKPLSFARGEALPPLDVDFAPLKEKRVTAIAPGDTPRAKSQSGNTRKSLELNEEFVGLPELCKLHGLLIAHLRKDDQPAHTMALFTRLWNEEAEFLFKHLDPRWLVSAITSFGDHGQTEVQRRVGTAMTVLFATMKLYESERLYSGLGPDRSFILTRLVRRKLPLNMDRFSLTAGGLDVNMLARLWLDAEGDRVIAPLAHHLLNMVNADPSTVFRRLLILKGRKIRQRRQKEVQRAAQTLLAAKPAPLPARAKGHSWGIVSTIKAPIDQMVQFTQHHLGMGASHINIHLDEPMKREDLARLADPRVTLTQCDDDYWRALGKPRPEKHQQRQALNATRSYRAATTDWLAHIDCDEFLHSDGPLYTALAAAPANIDALLMPPAEEIAQDAPSNELLFRRTYFDAKREKSVLKSLYPNFGDYLRSGFISHTLGKTIARTGLTDVRFGIHLLKRNNIEIENVERSETLVVLHRHAPDWDSFARHLTFRLTHGSYRDRGQARLGMADIIDVLREDHAEDGPKLLFDEVCTARPDVIETLERHNMLIRAQLISAPPAARDD